MNSQKIYIFCIVFMAFAAKTAFATPHKHASDTESEDEVEIVAPKEIDESGLQITPAPEIDKTIVYSSSEYRATQAIYVRLGTLLDLKKSGDLNGSTLVGAGYLMDRIHSPRWELGTDLLSNSMGLLHIFRKYTKNERETYRSYFKWGISHMLVPKEQLASLVNFKNYMGAVGGGVEITILNPISLRMELEIHLGLQFQMTTLFIGSSFGW